MEHMMAKKFTSTQKSLSPDWTKDDSDTQDSLLYSALEHHAVPEVAAIPFSQITVASNTPAPVVSTPGSSLAEPALSGLYSSMNSAKAGTSIASTTDSISKVYQHWADGDAARQTGAEWNNNILSDGKSDYFEAEVVPHVFYYKASNNSPLVQGHSYSFNITYNHYQANTNAGGFLYMTTADIDRHPANLLSTAPVLDSDGFVNGGGMQGNFQTVNANITAVSAVQYSDGGSGGSSIDGHVTVTFTYTGETTQSGGAQIMYGLMIAAPGMVPDQGHGPTLGAHAWSGGSLQTTVDIGGSGATSIQLSPSAIIPGEISGMKFSDINGDGVRDADGVDNLAGTSDDESGLSGWTIFLDKNGNGTLDGTETSAVTDTHGHYTFSVTPDADPSDLDNDPYIVREVQQSGWMQTTANPVPILITALDPTEKDVNFGNMQLHPSLDIIKEAVIAGGTADAVGEIIHYTLAVQNTGNQTLTGVQVTDPFISDLTLVADATTGDGELDVGETWHYTASHAVTQAEIDAGVNIVNTATADSDQTGPDTAQAAVPVTQMPSLNIIKEAVVAGDTADAVGEIIHYTLAVQNTGNQTLTGVQVTDPFISDLTLVADAATGDGELDVGEIWHYTASHAVTQAEIDAGVNIVNTATADSDQTGPASDGASIPVEQKPAIAIDKAVAGVTGGNGNASADAAGDVLNYTVTVSNTGNVTLTEVTVEDDMTPLSITGVTLAPGESKTYLTSYTLTQQDINTNGGGNGYFENTATADSAQTDAVSDMEPIPLAIRSTLSLNKSLSSITGGNGNSVADAAGDLLNYTVMVANIGSTDLTHVSVTDPSTGMDIHDVTLAPGQSAVYATTYTLTQEDLDSNGGGDGFIDNVAIASSDQTLPETDGESTALLRTIGLGVDKRVTGISGGNSNAFADAAGDLLHYEINVYNPGTVTLTHVTVLDELTGLTQTIDSLAPGAQATYNTTYTLTQADLDSNGGGNGYIENLTAVDSDQTDTAYDNETVQLLRVPVLYLNKTFLNVTGGNGNNLVDAVGDSLNYSILVANPSNVTLTDVSVDEPLTGLHLSNLTLAPGVSQTYVSSYLLTQDDLDNNGGNDGYIDNIAVADSAQTSPVSDIESVPILRSVAMTFDKHIVGITGGNGNQLADAAGDVLNYSFTVTNPGTTTLTQLTVDDNLTGMHESLAALAPGATVVYNASYTLTQAELDSQAGGTGVLVNIATASSHEIPSLVDTEGISLVYQPSIDLTKYVSVDNGVTWDDANAPTGPSLASGSGISPQFKYTVSNNGNITLADVVLTDAVYDLNGGETGTAHSFGTLDVGASLDFIFTGASWAAGQQSGDATVTVAAMPAVLDIDNAYYLGV
jgi:uncharacterized repeat protein (TIGR01451 family)